MYINPDPAFARFNDLPVPMDPVAFATLREHGIDATLARHIAHLFVRDALVSYSDFASMWIGDRSFVSVSMNRGT